MVPLCVTDTEPGTVPSTKVSINRLEDWKHRRLERDAVPVFDHESSVWTVVGKPRAAV